MLLLPIERVERIEVMRGPRSSIHGGFAYPGVIKVITRKPDARVFVTGDSEHAASQLYVNWAGIQICKT